MKLTKLHLFLMIMVILTLSTLGFSIKEYFSSDDAIANQIEKKVGQVESKSLAEGSSYNPFGTNDYSGTIAGLEDIVVPGRGRRNKNGVRYKDNIYNRNGELYYQNDEDSDAESDAEYETEYDPDTGIDMTKYILKSEIVPPVCPKCPDSRTCPRSKPCPACPACERCPEPAFECKKVPNYSAISASSASGLLPMPQLNSFPKFN